MLIYEYELKLGTDFHEYFTLQNTCIAQTEPEKSKSPKIEHINKARETVPFIWESELCAHFAMYGEL